MNVCIAVLALPVGKGNQILMAFVRTSVPLGLSRLPACTFYPLNDPDRSMATTSHDQGMAAHRKSVSIGIITPQSVEGVHDRQASDHRASEVTEQPANHPAKKDVRFWGIMVAICIASLLGGLEITVVTTSLPSIVNELGIGNDYVWITNILFLTR
jgi:hypothetical protein